MAVHRTNDTECLTQSVAAFVGSNFATYEQWCLEHGYIPMLREEFESIFGHFIVSSGDDS